MFIATLLVIVGTGCSTTYEHKQTAKIVVTKEVDGKVVSVEKTEYDRVQEGHGPLAGAHVVYDNRGQASSSRGHLKSGRWVGHGYYYPQSNYSGSSRGGGAPYNYGRRAPVPDFPPTNYKYVGRHH